MEGAGFGENHAIKAWLNFIEANFHRVQFTWDLLPVLRDLTGTEIYRPQEGRFEFQPSPCSISRVVGR